MTRFDPYRPLLGPPDYPHCVPLETMFGRERNLLDYLLMNDLVVGPLLGSQIVDIVVEHVAGEIRADALANLEDERTVVVETGYGISTGRQADHVASCARIIRPHAVIWIAEWLRQEDRDTIRKLNAAVGPRVYGVELRLYILADGRAMLFPHVVEGPSQPDEPEARSGASTTLSLDHRALA